MAHPRKNNHQTEVRPQDPVALHLERLTRLLVLLAVKGDAQNEKMRVLSSVGFSNVEIAGLLGLTANAVNVGLHRVRAKK